MSDVWATIIVLAVLTAVIKASGPVLLSDRELPPLVTRMIVLLAPALLAALVAVGTFTATDADLELDARAAGLGAAAGVLVWRRSAMLLAAVMAAATAATVRAIA